MHCEYCGNYVDDSDETCPSCGARIDRHRETLPEDTFSPSEYESYTPSTEEYERDPLPLRFEKNYLVWSILCTVLLLQPLGIPAIVFGVKVIIYLRAGDADKAEKASKKAKTWTWIAFIAGILMLYLGYKVSGK